MDIAVVSAGVNLTIDEHGVVTAARVALGAAAPTVLLVEEAAEALIGRSSTKQRSSGWQSLLGRLPPHRRQARYDRFQTKVAGVLAAQAAIDRLRTCRRQMMAIV